MRGSFSLSDTIQGLVWLDAATQVPSQDPTAAEAHFLQVAIDMAAATNMHCASLRRSKLLTSSHFASSTLSRISAMAAAGTLADRCAFHCRACHAVRMFRSCRFLRQFCVACSVDIRVSPRECLEARLNLESVRVLRWCLAMLGIQ